MKKQSTEPLLAQSIIIRGHRTQGLNSSHKQGLTHVTNSQATVHESWI